MKKGLKRCLVTLITCSMAFSSLVGCGVKATETAVSEETVKAETTESVAAAGTEAAESEAAGEITKATEGSLTIYTAYEDDQIEKYLASFYEKYPDIELNVVRESTGTLISKVIAEKENPIADIVWGTAATVLLQLEQYDLIKGYTPLEADKLDDRFKDAANPDAMEWTGNDVIETAFLVNTDVCEKAGVPVPTSFEELADPKYQGMVVMPDPTSSGTGMLCVNGILQIMGEEEGWNYISKLNDNIASYTTSGSKPAKMAAAGECGIGISFGYRCAQLSQDGGPVQVVFPSEGCGWEAEANCLINKETINSAAYTFLDWSISEEAMQEYSADYPITGRGVIGEIPEGYSEKPLDNLCDLDISSAASAHDAILEQFTPFLSGKVSE